MTKSIGGGVLPVVVGLGLVCVLVVAQPARAFDVYALLEAARAAVEESRKDESVTETAKQVATRESNGVQAKLGIAILSGIPTGHYGFPPIFVRLRPKSLDLASAGALREASQPTLALRIFEGFRPGSVSPTLTMFVLNNSNRIVAAGGQLADGPVHVDFIDSADLSYNDRVDLAQGLGEASFDPVDMAVKRDYTRLVVAVRGTDTRFDPRPPIPHHLTVIDTATATIAKRINLPDLHRPVSLAVSPDGATAYVLSVQTDESLSTVLTLPILFVDIASGAVTGRIELEPAGFSTTAGECETTPDGALLFVRGPRGIYMIDVATRTVSALITGVGTATHLAMHPHGTELYAGDVVVPASESDPSRSGIAVIDVATAQITEVIRVPSAQGGSRQDLRASGTGRLLMHMDSISGTWTFLDAVTRSVIDQIDIEGPIFQGAIVEGL